MKTEQKWKICDCLAGLPEIPDKSVDMILTDLPYGTTKCSWDFILSAEDLWGEYRRILKNNAVVVLFMGYLDAINHIKLNLDLFRYDLIWEKSNPANVALANIQPLRYHENIFIFYKEQPTYNKIMIPRMSKSIRQAHKNGYIFKGSTESKTSGFKNKDIDSKVYSSFEKNPSSILPIPSIKANSEQFVSHPTQKPLALFEYLIKTYTNEGDMVHDSCLGSGTTLEACMHLNRNCIGFEISNQWEEDYKKRLLIGNVRFV